jgi:hypothetical protein
MDGTEYLKFMTERVVSYIDKSIEGESDDGQEADQDEGRSREPWLIRWFGVLPMGIMMWLGGRGARKNKTHSNVRSVNPSNYR